MTGYLTATQAGAALGIGPRRVISLIVAGRLRAEQVGRQWFIRPAALEAVRVRRPGRPMKTRTG